MPNSNRLAEAASPSLRAAEAHPVNWHEWTNEAFAKARQEDKPILLSVGASWCHWCHVMDQESYTDPGLAARINESFVAIRVDRDERPEVDARYQSAVAAISGQGGWPLTVFLTPEGNPFSGGTYFAAADRVGRPGFGRILQGVARAFQEQRAEVEESGAGVLEAVEASETLTQTGDANQALYEKLVHDILEQADWKQGGFGSQPKFPHAATLALLLDAAGGRDGELKRRAGEIVRLTLDRMALGGLQDQLDGGFHRYSTDERWSLPRFEKMAHENSALLLVYVRAVALFASPLYSDVAERLLRWMEETLCDREHGGYYAGLNGEAQLGDHGRFYTWSVAEAREVLTAEELAITERHMHLRAIGQMPQDPARNVLEVVASLETVAKQLAVPLETARERWESAREKLLAARSRRQAPAVDSTMYTGWNALCISAALAAGRALGRRESTAFALRSLDRVLRMAWSADKGLRHVVHYGAAPDVAPHIPASLEEYAYLGHACLDAWEATGEAVWVASARELADYLLRCFEDKAGVGFFDLASPTTEVGAGLRLGALAVRRKPIQDAPTPAGNAAAAMLLLRLHPLTGEAVLREKAETVLRGFAGVAEQLGLYVAGYGQALRMYLSGPVLVCVVGEDQLAERLADAASRPFGLHRSVVRLRREQVSEVPSGLAGLLSNLPAHEASSAMVFQGGSWEAPVFTPEELAVRLGIAG